MIKTYNIITSNPITYLLLFLLFVSSCNNSNNEKQKGLGQNRDKAIVEKENESLKKENELLKKENSLIKKEQELNQRVIKPSTKLLGNLDFLKNFNGKYPYQVKLLDHPKLKKRLKTMLNSQYAYVKDILEVEAPIEINNGLFCAYGGQAHSGGDTGVILMADIENNVLFVGIRSDGKEDFYSENGSNIPKRMQEWANEQ